MPEVVKANVLKKEYLKEDIVKFGVKAEGIVKSAKPGNFLEIKVSETTYPFLRRPISIYNIEKSEGILEFIVQIKGEGTKLLCEKIVGDTVDIIGPLGFGTFKYEKYQKIAIIGGGIGVFPLYELAKEAKVMGRNVNIYLGYRNKDYVVLEKEFRNVSDKLVVTTDDGSYGENGFAIKFLEEDLKKEKADCIYACGPLPMLRAIKELSMKENIPCQVSLEQRMGCGIGACLGCSVKKANSSKENPQYFQVCKGGPVFFAKDVDF